MDRHRAKSADPPVARTSPNHAGSLLRSVGLDPLGPVLWGESVASVKTGVYVVELDRTYDAAPIDQGAVMDWITSFPAMRLDGRRPSIEALAGRLADFWIPSRSIIYIGCTMGPLHERVDAYYRTRLGERSPHRGGYWVKTLSVLTQCRVWWAKTEQPRDAEDQLLEAFGRTVPDVEAQALHDPLHVYPFANLEDARKVRKDHGLLRPTK